MSPTDEPKTDLCASCGEPGASRLETGVVDVPLCDDCTDHLQFVEPLGYVVHTPTKPLPPPEQRFRALFEAARVLLEQDEAEEDQVIPTLAFAHLIEGGSYVNLLSIRRRLLQASGDSEEWERASDEFARYYTRLRPVCVTDGVVILERLPVSIHINIDLPDELTPKEVDIIVYPHRRLAKAEHVAQLYERVLSDADISPEEQDMGSMSFDFHRDTGLGITVYNGVDVERFKRRYLVSGPKKASFPHPRLVQEFYRMLLGSSSGEGFARHLAARKRGAPPIADNLIPACVASYVRNYGGIGSRGEVHRLLNEHVLRKTHKSLLPLDALGSSKTNQLWRDVGKVDTALRDSSFTLVWLRGE